MRRIGAWLIVAAACLAVSAHAEDEPWPAEKRTVRIPMRDGKSLAADVHLPPKAGRYPVIVIQTPYSRRFHGAERPGGKKGGLHDRENYAYVVVDWRGFHGSKDARVPGKRSPLGQDGHDVVEWSAAQSWSNGRVGTWGPSALGKVQLQTAAARPPHLVCAVPVVAGYGHRYEDYYEGGVWKEEHLRNLDRLGFGISAFVKGARLSDSAVYRMAQRAERYDRMDVPMLFITGWYDHGTARHLQTFETLLEKGGEKARAGSRLLVGPWHHTAVDLAQQGDVEYPDAAGEGARETQAFFDHHLRGVDNGWEKRARVRIWRANETGWRDLDRWPAAERKTTTLHLHPDGTLRAPAPAADAAVRSYVDEPKDPVRTVGGANLPGRVKAGPRDQAPLLGRDDVLVYSTPPLEEPIRLSGRAELTVTLTTDRADTDVAVRLCEVFPDGTSMLVADGIHRAKFRNGTAKAEPLTPGEAVVVTVALPPLAFTFRKGHRLSVIIAGTNWPRFERNDHTGGAAWDRSAAVPARVSIHHGGATPSHLVLPVR